MPLPVEVQTVTVNFGPFKDFLGAVLKGETIFTPSTSVKTSTGVPLVAAPLRVVWDGTGSGTITLPASDSTGLDRTGFTYEATHRPHATGVPAPRGGPFLLPAAAPVVDLEDLVDTEVSPGLVIAQPAVVSVAGLSGTPSAQEVVTALDVPLRAAFRTPPKRGAVARQRAPLAQWSSGREMCGVDAVDGRYFSFNSTGLYQVASATSGGWQAKGIPANTTATAKAKVVRFGAKLYLVIKNSVSNRFEVYSMDPVAGGTAFTYSAALKTMAAGATIIGTVFTAGSQNLFLGEYGDPTGGPSIYRSADGTTWETVLTVATARHCHAVVEDPYNPGHVYATFGDAGSPGYVYRSTQHGAAGTWTLILSDGDWQSVQVTFTPELVWFASDQQYGSTVYTMDRTTLVPRWQSKRNHQMTAVPGGVGGRVVTDLVATSGSPTITSATAAFTAADVGRFVSGPNVLPDGHYITGVTNGTTATLSSNATGSGSALTATIGGDRFYGNAYFGAVDPVTGIYYCVAADSSVSGNTSGLFCLFPGDDELTLLSSLPSVVAADELFIAGGYLWFHRYNRPLITF